MKYKYLKIIGLLCFLSIILVGCGKKEGLFDDIENNQAQINLANPVVEEETEAPSVAVVEPERNPYYDRYIPDENGYLPVQMPNTSYLMDENENNIPNSLLNPNYSRENLRNITCLVDNYNIAINNELSWKYFYKDNIPKLSKDYFTLTKALSFIGQKKNEEMTFDDLKITANYNSTNCNNVESFAVNLYNLDDTAQGIEVSNQILSNMVLEDMTSVLMNKPNDLDSDTKQSFSTSLETEDKNSTYSFYREFNTPLKESSDKVSASFDIKFRDSLSQKQIGNNTVINNQKEKFKDIYGLDFGDFLNSDAFKGIFEKTGCFTKLERIQPQGSFKLSSIKKQYENLKYTIYNEDTNLNPEDKFEPFEEYSYDTNAFIYSVDNTDKKNKQIVKTGDLNIKYNYKKLNNQFSSLALYIEDIFSIPKDTVFAEGYNINDLISTRAKYWLGYWDLTEYSIALDEEATIFLDINDVHCKAIIKPIQYVEDNFIKYKIDISIESDDIYGFSQTNIISDETAIEYDIEGNIIRKDKIEQNSDIIEDSTMDFETETESEEMSLEEETTENESETQTEENTKESETEIENSEEESPIQEDSKISGGNLSDLF